MNTRSTFQAQRHHLATFSAIGSLLLSSAVLVACGGGGGVAGGGTGFSAGTVTGKGSTIVNGVRFDDSSASILGEDDSGGHGTDDVKVGMEVEVEHGVVTCTPDASSTVSVPLPDICTATASKLSFGNNSLVAPISNFVAGNAAATPATFASFDLLGAHVVTTAATSVNLESLVAGLANGVVVEVHGVYNPTTQTTTATRIEVKAGPGTTLPATLFFRLRGVLDKTAGTIGGTAVDLSDAAIQAAITSKALDGKLVRVKLDNASTPPKVLAIKSAERKLDDQAGREAEVEGVITDFAPAAPAAGSAAATNISFKVGGASVSVPATGVTYLNGASAASLANGQRVEVEGSVNSNGVLVARKVALHNEANDAALEFEFHGRLVRPADATHTNECQIKNASGALVNSGFVNTYSAGARTFEIWTTVVPYTLRQTIKLNDSTKFVGNKGASFSESQLAGLCTGGLVVVYGTNQADGTILATKIKNDTSTE